LKKRETAGLDDERQSTLARHARELVRVDPGTGKSFAEFAAFDLSLDEEANTTLAAIRSEIPATDVVVDQLTCLWHLLCLEPNPEAVDRFLARSFGLLAQLETLSRATELPSWVRAYRELAERLETARPDVAEVISAHLAAFCTPARASWIVDLASSGPEGRKAADRIIAALGPAVAGPLVALLDRESEGKNRGDALRSAVSQLLADHAAALSPALPPLLHGRTRGVLRLLLRVLGSAGRGHEQAIAALVSADDEHTAREALRALARVGTEEAAELVVAEILRQRGTLAVAAEETLWHFPAAEAQRQARALLGRREFALSHPHAAERLLDRAARTGGVDLGPILQDLAPLRFRIWNPALARVARKAHAILKS
jgi:hypothetical protein